MTVPDSRSIQTCIPSEVDEAVDLLIGQPIELKTASFPMIDILYVIGLSGFLGLTARLLDGLVANL
jgi:hypothetical protein